MSELKRGREGGREEALLSLVLQRCAAIGRDSERGRHCKRRQLGSVNWKAPWISGGPSEPGSLIMMAGRLSQGRQAALREVRRWGEGDERDW